MDIKTYEKLKKRYALVRSAKENMCMVIQDSALYDQLYGFVDESTGKTIVPCKKYMSAHDFNEGRAVVQDRTTKKWGVINTEGKEIVPCIYDHIRDYKNGIALGFVSYNNVEILNRTGDTIVRRRFDFVNNTPDEKGIIRAYGDGFAYIIQTGDTAYSLGPIDCGGTKGAQADENSVDVSKMLTRLETYRHSQNINSLPLTGVEPNNYQILADSDLFEKYVYTMRKEADWELMQANTPEKVRQVVSKHRKFAVKINLASKIVSARESEEKKKQESFAQKSRQAKQSIDNIYNDII